ncbi:MAG: peptidyl-prolyl cis-trans isomerase [Bdellovibrionales bacterium]|nr:peptidyl-prolyl cis-trans isomerase [Bdellovibrionales bacterium]
MKNSFNRCNSLVFFLAVFFLPSCFAPFSSPILLKIDERSWTVQEFKRYVNLHLKTRFSNQTPVLPSLLKKRMINELILKALMESWLAEHNFKVSVNTRIVPEKNLLLQKELSLRDFRQRQKDLHLRETFLKHLSEQDFKPSSREVRAFYKKHKKDFFEPPACQLEQILISSKGMALTLFRRLEEGESFKQLARLYSEGPEKSNEGFLGWVLPGTLKVFDEACKLEKGVFGPLQKSVYGYHILRVLKKRPGRQKTLSQSRGDILSILKKQHGEKAFEKWLKTTLSETSIYINEKLLDRLSIQYKTKVRL